jgi:predicted DNA binding CopG/RHH family protein
MKNESITIRISEAEKEQLKAIAARKDVPMSQIIREVVKDYIQKEAK